MNFINCWKQSNLELFTFFEALYVSFEALLLNSFKALSLAFGNLSEGIHLFP